MKIFDSKSGQPVSSLLIDHLVMSIETKKQFEDIGYYLWRFRHSTFGYKLRGWTINLLAMRALEFKAYDALLELLTDSDKFGKVFTLKNIYTPTFSGLENNTFYELLCGQRQ